MRTYLCTNVKLSGCVLQRLDEWKWILNACYFKVSDSSELIHL